MNKELIETVESLGGTALMGGILIQFSDTTFAEALKKIYEAGVEAEREACAKTCEQITNDMSKWHSAYLGVTSETKFIRKTGEIIGQPFIEAIRARGQT